MQLHINLPSHVSEHGIPMDVSAEYTRVRHPVAELAIPLYLPAIEIV